MPPDRVCAAAGRADASDAPTSAPRISRRWGLKSCMGEILAPPRGARRTPWPVAGGQARRPVLLGWSGGRRAPRGGGGWVERRGAFPSWGGGGAPTPGGAPPGGFWGEPLLGFFWGGPW